MTKIIYRLIVVFLIFAFMITVPLTFAVKRVHDAFSSRLLEQIIPYSFYILVMALMFSIFLSRKMLVSLKELLRGAKSIMNGDLDVTLRVTGNDELAAVTRAFNEMAASLQEKTLDLQRKNTYVNAMLDPLWVVDEMNLVTDVNPAFLRLFGYSREKVIGALIYDFFDEQNAAIIRTQVHDITEKKIAAIYEVNIITRDRSFLPVLISGSPIIVEGRVVGKIGIFKDFREQKKFTSEIERARDFVETVVNSIEDQLLVIDRDYRVVTANRKALEHISGPAVGQYCYLISHDLNKPCWSEGHECPAQSVFLSGGNIRTTHQHVGPGGEKRFHEIVATPIRDASGNVTQVIELIRDVTDRIRREEEISLKNRDLMALNSIAGLLSRSLSADEIFMNVLDRMIEMIRMDGGGIFFIDEVKRDMVCQYHRGISEEYIRTMGRIRMGEDIPGKVAVTGQIITTSDISKDSRIERSLMKHSGMKGYCCIPVRGKERIIGVFCLFSFKQHFFTAEEENILNSIGEMTGIALENIKLYEKMRDMYEQQRKRRDDEHGQLLALTTKLGSAVDLRYVVGNVLELIRNMFNADFTWLLVRDSGDNYILRASCMSKDLEDRVLYPPGVSSIEGYAAEKRMPTVIADIRAGSRFYVPDEIGSLGYQSALAVPMQIGEKTVGVFTLYYRRARDFRDEELHFLRIIANMLAVSLERYDYYVRSISEKGIASTIVQSVADGIVTVDTQGRIIAINRAFEQMTGMQAEEAVGLSVCEALRYTRENLDLRISLGECLESALSGKSINRDAVMTTASGEQLSVLITGTPVLDTDGAVTGVVSLIRDIGREGV
ncbi:MAG: PAS domain-containing protein [Thermodesulfovibrionales bacterium]